MTTYHKMTVQNAGHFEYEDDFACKHSARFDLALIRMAWHGGCDFEALADGFGAGLGTCGGDWSGIRDSSEAATVKMLEKAMNFIERQVCLNKPARKPVCGKMGVAGAR